MKKNKILVTILITVILVCVTVLVSVGCDLVRCPGDESSGGRDNCNYRSGANYYYQCSERCITKQGTWVSGSVYSFNSPKSCDCKL